MLSSLRSMQNVMEVKGTYRSFDERMTNVLNRHTCTTHRLDLILAMVFVVNSKPVEVIGDMIRGARVSIP
jgi:hypothetical protein